MPVSNALPFVLSLFQNEAWNENSDLKKEKKLSSAPGFYLVPSKQPKEVKSVER